MAAALKLPASSFPTASGTALSGQISAARDALHLTRVLGCSHRNYEGRELTDLYMKDVVPTAVLTSPTSQWYVQSTGGLRYDLYQGNVSVDDVYKILPFRDTFSASARSFNGSTLRAVLARLNSKPPPLGRRRGQRGLSRSSAGASGGDCYVSTDDTPNPSVMLSVVVGRFDRPYVVEAIEAVTGMAVSVGDYRPGLTDTDAMLAWAGEALGQPCPRVVEPRRTPVVEREWWE